MNGHCPQCEIDIPRVLNAMELEELAEEIRHMMIKSEKISYWKQFEHGVLSREAVRVLINLADTVLDTPDRYIVYCTYMYLYTILCFILVGKI